jgi:DNA-binding MarR family transcriptional regulator
MHKRMSLLVALLFVASSAMAQVQDEEVIPAAKIVDPDADSLLDKLLQEVGDAAESFGNAVGSTTDGVQSGATALIAFLSQTATALTDASAIVAIGFGTVGTVIAKGLGATVAAVGELVIAAIAFAGTGVGVAVAFLAKAYGALIISLRPDGMSSGAYMGMTAGAASVSTGAASWSGWQALRKWGYVGSGLAVPIAGFSRINDDQLLEHPVRAQIFTTIKQHPGIHASQLAREVGVGWGTVSHHLDKLSKATMVTTRKVNNQKCFFEHGGTVSRQDMEAAGAVKGETAGAIAGFVHRHPMTSQKDLADALGISAALTSFHVKKLTNLGVLEKMRHGKETLLTTSSSMRRLLDADADLAVAMEQRTDEVLQYGA